MLYTISNGIATRAREMSKNLFHLEVCHLSIGEDVQVIWLVARTLLWMFNLIGGKVHMSWTCVSEEYMLRVECLCVSEEYIITKTKW